MNDDGVIGRGEEKDALLVRLVRRFHPPPPLLPAEGGDESSSSTRIDSEDAAREIEALTGHPMPGTRVLPDLRRLDDRRDFLLRIRPIVRAMEDGKRNDAEETERHTRCVARKDDGKGGGYSYRDADTGHRVSPDEYRRRYAAMIYASRQERRGRGAHRDDGRAGGRRSSRDHSGPVDIAAAVAAGDSDYAGGADEGGGGLCDEDPPRGGGGGDEGEGTKDGIECRDEESDADADESTSMDDSSSTIPHDDREPVVRDDDDGGGGELSPIGTTTASCTRGDRPSRDDALPRLTASAPSSSDVDPPSTDAMVEGASSGETAGRGKERRDDDDDDGRTPRRAAPSAAGMPSSDDPRVLEARRRLWTAIDAALADYSREIVAMERSRRGGIDYTEDPPNG